MEERKDLPISVIVLAQQGDQSAGLRVHHHYRNYVKRIASLYYRKGRSDWDDHVAIAYGAIATALRHFDSTKSDSFIGYLSVILKRSLVGANKANAKVFDHTIFLDHGDQEQFDELQPGYVPEIPSLSPLEEIKRSPDSFPARMFGLLAEDYSFHESCRRLGVRPTLARLIIAAHLSRDQVHHELISLFPHEFHIPQRMLFEESDLGIPIPRASWPRPRRRPNHELKRKQMNLFDLVEAC